MATNRSRKAAAAPGENPTPAEIRAARDAAELTQTQAAEKIYATLRTWQDWESGARRMNPAMWELWTLKVKHPDLFAVFEKLR